MASAVYQDGRFLHGPADWPMGGEDLAYPLSFLREGVSFALPLRVPYAAMVAASREGDLTPASLAELRAMVGMSFLL